MQYIQMSTTRIHHQLVLLGYVETAQRPTAYVERFWLQQVDSRGITGKLCRPRRVTFMVMGDGSMVMGGELMVMLDAKW